MTYKITYDVFSGNVDNIEEICTRTVETEDASLYERFMNGEQFRYENGSIVEREVSGETVTNILPTQEMVDRFGLDPNVCIPEAEYNAYLSQI